MPTQTFEKPAKVLDKLAPKTLNCGLGPAPLCSTGHSLFGPFRGLSKRPNPAVSSCPHLNPAAFEKPAKNLSPNHGPGHALLSAMTRKHTKAQEAAITAGRAYLRTWLEGCNHIYYTIPHVSRSGMVRHITLHKVLERTETSSGFPELVRLWPAYDEDLAGAASGCGTFADGLDAIAKDWGFAYEKRAFVVGGCGMDMVFSLIANLHAMAGLKWDQTQLRYESIS